MKTGGGGWGGGCGGLVVESAYATMQGTRTTWTRNMNFIKNARAFKAVKQSENESRYEKTNILHMRKQRRRSALRLFSLHG